MNANRPDEKKPELLSPAGSPEALRAAVAAGADAVYLGAPGFNARAGARGFSAEELFSAVEYAHKYGVSVHAAINTLVSDIEMRDFLSAVRMACEAGADALIVQDLGALSLIRRAAPDMPLHASTQMSVHSLDGALEAARLGASRVILARELSRGDIEYITKRSPVETEVFVHGAMCMSHSGQCLFSAMIAGRSGNRGRCGQPCRLMYERGDGRRQSLLSLKDMCLAAHIGELRDMGVASFKIEGRLKRPEYVALVTSVYRRLIDEGGGPTEGEMRDLETIFSREGFTDGYYMGKKGAHMFGMHRDNSDTPEYRALLSRAKALCERPREEKKTTVDMSFYARADERARLFARAADGRKAIISGDVPERAKTRALDTETVRARLVKTGGTPFSAGEITIDIEDGLSMRLSQINDMRREALIALADAAGKKSTPFTMPKLSPTGGRGPKTFGVSVCIDDIARLPESVASEARIIYTPIEAAERNAAIIAALTAAGRTVFVKLPRVYFDREKGEIEKMLARAKSLGVSGALCMNIGQIAPVRAMGLLARCGFSLNAYNSYTLEVLKDMGAAGVTLSYELTLPKIRDMAKPVETELLIYGRQELMITENCLNGGRGGEGCSLCKRMRTLTDRRGEKFLVRGEFGCRTTLLNGHVLYMLDKLSDIEGLGVSLVRFDFTDESPEEIERILTDFKAGGGAKPSGFTRGLYYKGAM
ncbi:MAG: U32 family peptidase [Clostridia bacterium]|nr:U32 family peptidase [Clostridia bacterium]